MIRPEFRKILMDQRGAAVILWSFFVISIPVYVVIARSLLGNPSLGSNRTIAEPARIIFWLLTLVDLGYYAYWKKRNMSVQAMLQSAKATKLFPRPGGVSRGSRGMRRLCRLHLRHAQGRRLRHHRSHCGVRLCLGFSRPLRFRSVFAFRRQPGAANDRVSFREVSGDFGACERAIAGRERRPKPLARCGGFNSSVLWRRLLVFATFAASRVLLQSSTRHLPRLR